MSFFSVAMKGQTGPAIATKVQMALSSSGLGRGPLTAETRVRFPYALQSFIGSLGEWLKPAVC